MKNILKNKIFLSAIILVVLISVFSLGRRSNSGGSTIVPLPVPTDIVISSYPTAIITSAATHAVITFGNPTLKPTIVDETNSRQNACRVAGGTWRNFPNTCADKCDQPACGEAEVDSCDCGADKCWDGKTCVPYSPFWDEIQ